MPVGIVANSAKAAVMMAPNRKQRKLEFLSMLKSHRPEDHKPIKSVKQFNVEYLNTGVSVGSIVNHAKQYATGKYMGRKRFSMLFHGIPGTGKSEFARYLAELMKYEAQVVLGSDIFSMGVGGTEQNIHNAFHEADGKVLIFDEADSMLSSRDNARQSWERTQVNEFLAQMDNFKGVLICITNHLYTLDAAAIRRFDRKMEFLPLKVNQIQNIVGAYFPAMDFNIYSSEMEDLKGLTPGDIAVVAGRFWDDTVKEVDIIDALADELNYKNPKQKVVGFSK
jgi:SpoVK/Ycf46/Vps4 family AAA+-type ATPase